MSWQTVLDVVDAIESWVAGQSYWVQVVLLLSVLGPLCYLLAGLIDRVIEAAFAWHGRRDQPAAGSAAPVTGESGPDQSGTYQSGTGEAVAGESVSAQQ